MSKRNLCVAGQFYPNDKDELTRYIKYFNEVIETSNINTTYNLTPKAIISPHAGYIYSGFTANIAFNIVKNKINPKRIIVIGPSHKFAFQGASVSLYDEYDTPFGTLDIDLEYALKLEKKYEFLTFDDKVHQEHSTETQMPFIKHYFPNTKVIEIIYSNCSYQNISQMIKDVLNDKDNFIVISTDLSHFYNLEDAQNKDNICLTAISKQDINILDTGCEACGMTGVKALLEYAQHHNLQSKLLDYRTSADASKDTSRVVGYTSFIFGV